MIVLLGGAVVDNDVTKKTRFNIFGRINNPTKGMTIYTHISYSITGSIRNPNNNLNCTKQPDDYLDVSRANDESPSNANDAWCG
jgi:hypothetical protein